MMQDKLRKLVLGIGLAILAVSVVWGFVLVGSPAHNRKVKEDEAAITDLKSLSYDIESYYGCNGKLPTSLDDLDPKKYGSRSLADSKGNLYKYRRNDDAAYELCSDFNLTKQEDINYNKENNIAWRYTAGHYCAPLTVAHIKPRKNCSD